MRAFSGLERHQGYRVLADQILISGPYATDADTNAERDCIVPELRRSRVISDVTSYKSGEHLPIERVNHYVTDGAVSVARGKLPEKICLHSRATAHATLSS